MLKNTTRQNGEFFDENIKTKYKPRTIKMRKLNIFTEYVENIIENWKFTLKKAIYLWYNS